MIEGTPATGWSVISLTPVSKSRPGLLAGLGEVGDRLDAVGGHQQRILLRSGADDAFLDALDAVAAAVDRDDENALFLAGGLERGVAAVGGRLVDRVDDVDLVGLLENVLHRLAAAFVRARGDVGADDLRAVARGEVLGILDLDAEAGEEAIVAQIVDGRLVGGRSSVAILALAALSPRVALAHSPISSPALKLSVAKVASAALIGSSGVSSVMTRMPALRAFSTVGTMAVESLGTSMKPLAPAAIRCSMAATWPSLSPSALPA